MRVREKWPLAVSVLLFLAILGAIVFAAMRVCDGKLIYPMDDTYIHMAVAKNLAQHGVWGVTRYAFSCSITSPLWTLVIAAVYLVTGVHECTPLVLTTITAILLLYVADKALSKASIRPAMRFLCLVALILAVPLPVLAVGGMEHVAQTLLLFLFLQFYIPVLLESEPRRRTFALLVLITGAFVLDRFEGVFTVAVAGFLLLLRRRWLHAVLLGLAGLVPPAVYGIISLLHGWYLVPNSILIKANLPRRAGTLNQFVAGILFNAGSAPWLPWVIPIAACLAYLVWRKRGTVWNPIMTGAILLTGTATLHLTFARVGWFFRYEAYLIAWAVVWVSIALADVRPIVLRPKSVTAVAVACLVASIASFVYFDSGRVFDALTKSSLAMKNIYDQPYHLGLFARDELPGATVVANDIGAISFLSDDRVLDVVGLGSIEPYKAMRHNAFNAQWLNAWIQREHATAALVHITGPWAVAPLPDWTDAGSWTIPDRYILACETVHVYALPHTNAAQVQQDFQNFIPHLPKDTTVKEYRSFDASSAPM